MSMNYLKVDLLSFICNLKGYINKQVPNSEKCYLIGISFHLLPIISELCLLKLFIKESLLNIEIVFE